MPNDSAQFSLGDFHVFSRKPIKIRRLIVWLQFPGEWIHARLGFIDFGFAVPFLFLPKRLQIGPPTISHPLCKRTGTILLQEIFLKRYGTMKILSLHGSFTLLPDG